jgi:hypothetical protein
VRQKVRQKIGERRSGPQQRGFERLTFGARPTLKSAENPVSKRARQDSNL